MLRNYQERERIKEKEVPTYEIATVISRTGGPTYRYRLRLPWGDTQKSYLAINGDYSANQKVRVQKTDGTYLIIGEF